MPAHRSLLVFIVALLLGVLPAPAGSVRPTGAQPNGVWVPAAPLGTARAAHTATTLADGRVLVVGGFSVGSPGPSLASAEVYEPATNGWAAVAPMSAARAGHRALLLAGGRVLVNPILDTQAEVYDPVTDRWVLTGPKTSVGGALAPLPGGRALSVGGVGVGDAEIYDPATNRWTPAAPTPTRRIGGRTATALPDGRVLVAGGQVSSGPRAATSPTATVEIYEPAADRWTSAAVMSVPRSGHTALALRDGRVFVFGGSSAAGATNQGAELYDPVTDRWAPAAGLGTRRGEGGYYTATLLPDGRVLVTGGDVPDDNLSTMLAATELYDPAVDRWTPSAPLLSARALHQAAPLRDGRVLVVGGVSTRPDRQYAATATAELYTEESALPRACFAETGFCVRGRFLEYWQQNGGLTRNGFPLGDERREVLEDGREYIVQYFERVRLELHPENAPPYDVLLGQFGRRVRESDPAAARLAPGPCTGPRPDRTLFPETNCTVGARFLVFWQQNGGLAQFGYPITEDFQAQLEDGNTYTVQYFERARFELHPENAAPNDVLLGQFGRRILAENALLATDAGFAQLYLANALWTSLGSPAGPTARAAGAYQGFERGAMLYRGDRRQIVALCGADPESGFASPADTTQFPSPFFPDTWEEGQNPGGGPGPGSGLFAPQRGFGKLWRERADIRQCLGYATAPGETGYTIRVQEFARGYLIAATTPAGRYIYLLGSSPRGGSIGYRRFPDPVP